jgi:hypothetical protein
MSIERREVNEFRLRTFGREAERPIAFICECADANCRRAVTLTRAAYDDLRRHGEPILFPAHVPDEDAPLGAERRETRGPPTAREEGPRSPEALELEAGS